MPSTSAISRSASSSATTSGRASWTSGDHGAAEVEVGLTLDLRQFLVGAGLPGEREGDHPVPGGVGGGRERVDEHRPQREIGREHGPVGVAGASAVERRLQREREQLALVREVVHERSGGPPGFGRHLAERCAVDAGASDHPSSGLGELAAALIGIHQLGH